MALLFKLILAVVGVGVVGTGVVAVLLVTGKPGECGPGRSVSVSPAVGQQVENSLRALYDGGGGSVTMDESQASSLSNNHAGDFVRNLKVCFESGAWQASGTIKVGTDIQVWMSGDLTISGRKPVVTRLTVRAGAVPEGVAGLVQPLLLGFVNDRLSVADVGRPTTVDFGAQRATVNVR